MTSYVPTMTVSQAYKRMSEVGIKTSPEKIRAMIDEGKYPWGVSCKLKERVYEIYTVLFEKWLAEREKTVDESELFDYNN